MQLTLGPFNATNGCSLQFKTRYVLECNYDYGYLEVFDSRPGRNRWRPIDGFNGRSGCTSGPTSFSCYGDWTNYRTLTKCPAQPFGTAVVYPRDFVGGVTPRDWPGFLFAGASGDDFVVIRGDSISATPAAATLAVRWRFSSDTGLSSADGNSAVKGFWVDDVIVRVAGATVHSQNFDALPENSLPLAPYSFPQLEPVYDGWAIRHDLDPPLEGYFLPSPGDSGLPSACSVNASWQWSIAGSPGGMPGGMPGPDNESMAPGYQVVLVSPAISLAYHEGGGPLARPGVTFQFDASQNMLEDTCDFTDTWVRTFRSATARWCDWINVDGFIIYGGATFWTLDASQDVSAYTATGADSVQLAWVSLDTGRPGDSCWDPGLPPHKETQYVIDNVSVQLSDVSATSISGGGANNPRGGMFQDTFNLHSCMHTPNVANSDLGAGRFLLTDSQESLTFVVVDPDFIVEGNVLLHYAVVSGPPPYEFTPAAGSPITMNLSAPHPSGTGGDFTATVCDTPWTPGRKILYYIEATDNLGNHAYAPSSAAPTSFPRSFFDVDVLPTPGASILYVDDFGGSGNDFHPCRSDTTSRPAEDFVTRALESMGFREMVVGGYDKYDVGAASSNQRINEPWGFRTAPADSPHIGSNVYDLVIWDTGALPQNTIQDTSQIFLKEFVFDGGNLVVFGSRISEDILDPSTAQDAEFLSGVLGAEPSSSGVDMASPFLNPDLQPKVAGVFPDLDFPAGDSLHLYTGCGQLRSQMDKVTLATAAPAWAHPAPFLYYEDTVEPYDSLAAIFNVVSFSPDTGRVFFFPLSASDIVDQGTVICSEPGFQVLTGSFRGRGNLLRNVLSGLGLAPRTGVATSRDQSDGIVTDLHPAAPSPFNPETRLSFTLAEASVVRLSIFDVTGRRVRTLVNERQPEGYHTRVWDGRNDSGREVSSGVYIVRMEVGSDQMSRKLTLLK